VPLLATLASGCVLLIVIIWTAWINPINKTVNSWTPESLPSNLGEVPRPVALSSHDSTCVVCCRLQRGHRRSHLSELNLKLEELRVLWRLVQQCGWISQQQLLAT
jgi:hypothetical protein